MSLPKSYFCVLSCCFLFVGFSVFGQSNKVLAPNSKGEVVANVPKLKSESSPTAGGVTGTIPSSVRAKSAPTAGGVTGTIPSYSTNKKQRVKKTKRKQ